MNSHLHCDSEVYAVSILHANVCQEEMLWVGLQLTVVVLLLPHGPSTPVSG